jgi:hypothetical protein
MSIGDPYITDGGLADRVGASSDNARLAQAVLAASREVELWCGRQFNKTDTATARTYRPATCTLLRVDDFYDDDITVDGWDLADLDLEPLNGVEAGVPGFPWRRLVACGSRRFTSTAVEVTAKWGWAEVPPQVVEATEILASELFKLKDAPLGVAGFGDFGPVRVRDMPQVKRLLAPLRRPETVLIA